MDELSTALMEGMTPVISYWSSDDMLWLDGKGADHLGPCAKDDASACAETVQFYEFSIADIGAPRSNVCYRKLVKLHRFRTRRSIIFRARPQMVCTFSIEPEHIVRAPITNNRSHAFHESSRQLIH